VRAPHTPRSPTPHTQSRGPPRSARAPPASPQLATLAEEGNTAPLAALLAGMPEVRDVAVSAGLLNPGATATILVEAGGPFDRVSVAAMLIPTNDGFFAVNDAEGPNGNRTLTLYSPAYDAVVGRDQH